MRGSFCAVARSSIGSTAPSHPIGSVTSLTPVAEVDPLSAWDSDFYGVNPKKTDLVRRYVIKAGPEPVEAIDGLYVYDPGESTAAAYYAVTVSTSGGEDKTVSSENSVTEAVRETTGDGTPVLQRTVKPARFNFVDGPTLDYYVRWESPPNASRHAVPLDYLVALPRARKEPAPVGIHLHAWGGNLNSGYGWWFNAEKGAILLSSNESPYDWWTGYHEFRFTDRKLVTPGDWRSGAVRPYSQRRLLSFLEWMTSKYSVDASRIFAGGNSMGGSGALMLAIRHPNQIAWAVGWVGVHRPAFSPFSSSYEHSFGKREWQVRFEDGTPVWDYFDDVWYLREHPDRSVGYLTFSNARNDKGIGWKQAVDFARALQETRQPHMFVWGIAGHGQRARMPAGGGGRVMPIDLRIDQSLPAFTNCSLDQRPGSGDPADGDPTGQLNAYLGLGHDGYR